MIIVVQRGNGLRPGPDIIEPLINTAGPAIERGRVAIDESATPGTLRVELVHRTGLRKGQLVLIHDPLQGQSWRGQIESIEHRRQGPEVTSIINLRRP